MINRLIIIAVLGFYSNLRAAALQFPEHNFSVELPAQWIDITPRPPQTIVAAQSTDNSRRIVVVAVKILKAHETAAADFRAGVKDSISNQGWKIEPEQQVTINGQPFISFTAHIPSGGKFTAYTTAAGGEVYMLQAVGGANSSSDPELQSIVQSFRFLSPAEIHPLDTPSKSPAYRAGYIFGQISCFVGIVWIIWSIIRRSRKVTP